MDLKTINGQEKRCYMKVGDLVHSEWGKLGILMWPIEGGHKWMVHWQNGNQYDMECCYLHVVKKCP